MHQVLAKIDLWMFGTRLIGSIWLSATATWYLRGSAASF